MSRPEFEVDHPATSRRDVLRLLGAMPLIVGGCASGLPTPTTATRTLRAMRGTQQLSAKYAAPTALWTFDGQSPGPTLRYRQGDTVDLLVENTLDVPTTVHWHGLRVPIAMDGVPYVSQQPIQPGEHFRYRFTLPDAGTYWYHPHFQSQEQVVRGLYGAFIVEESKPIEVDHDLTWVLADWLLDNAGALRTDFDDPRDMSHAGRLGNLVTVNGQQAAPATTLAAGSRVRLRLINAASARIFLLQFENANPTVIAYDGQPVTPHALPGDRLVLGPAMRADLIIDMPTGGVRVIDRVDVRRPNTLGEFATSGTARDRGPVVALPSNPLPEPDMARARRFEVVLEGGARGTLNAALVNGKPTPIASMVREHGLGWAMNGIANAEHNHAPLLALGRNESALIAITNRTEWPHPMHLHGHAFRVLSMNGKPTRHREWRDTVLVEPKGSAEIAFVADNPGDWMFHCHILQHQRGGMMGSIRVE